jgi:uncharacterized membrane protein YhhN
MSAPLRFFFVLFFFIVVADLYVLSHLEYLRWLTKPFIVLSLLCFFVLKSKERLNQEFLFLIAIFAALLGDIFLLWEDKFLWGLGLFLVMQLLYSLRFAKDWGDLITRDKIVISITFIVLLISLVILWPHLSDMKIPVLIYSIAICLMSVSAYLRKKSLSGHMKVFIGTLFFIISDSILGYRQFVFGFPYSGLLVMSSYSIAQYLIITGITNSQTSSNS